MALVGSLVLYLGSLHLTTLRFTHPPLTNQTRTGPVQDPSGPRKAVPCRSVEVC